MDKKRTPALLNDKDILTDAITSVLYDDEQPMETPDNKGCMCDLLGFFNDCLLEAKWSKHSNRLCLHFIDIPERYATQSARDALKTHLLWITAENEGLEMEITDSGGWILADFYFKED